MEDDEQNKSEKATPFKLSKAREKGAVARSPDLGFLAALLTLLGFASFMGPKVKAEVALAAHRVLVSAPRALGGAPELLAQTGSAMAATVAALTWLGVWIFCVTLVFELVQTGPIFTFETLKLDLSRLSPAKAFRRIFSTALLIHTAKSLLKMAIYCACAGFVVQAALRRGAAAITGAESLAAAMGGAALQLLVPFVAAAAFFAALDQFLVRREFGKNMRMSRREVRRESRDREGDPRMRQRRKQLHREFVKLSQSLRNVKGADVLLVNPTHYAVALRYEPSHMAAPKIVAQASNLYAARLRRLAFTYGVVIIQNEQLARSLYTKGELNKTIPEVFYRAVADIYITLRTIKAGRAMTHA